MYRPALQRDPARHRSPTGDKGVLFEECLKLAGGIHCFRREGNNCCYSVYLAITAEDRAITGIAEPSGCFGEGVEHRSQVKSRTADDLEHVAGRGLVFESFLEVASP